MQTIGRLFNTADSFEPHDFHSGELSFQPDIFRMVWAEAKTLRQTGHTPWKERNAREGFFRALRAELE